MTRMLDPATNTTAILDTNVFLDIYSCHDVTGTYDNLYLKLGVAALDEQQVVYRRARARESLLLAMFFNKTRATTFGLHNEAIELLVRCAPPSKAGGGPGGALESCYTSFFVHFVRDYVLPDWNHTMPTEPGDAASNAADRLLVETAKLSGLPLITNEGYTPAGIVNERMRKLALDDGVLTFTPREFYQGKIDEAEEAGGFLRRFREQAPGYLEARRNELGPDKGHEVMSFMDGYFRHIFFGETEGRKTPVRVAIA
jgi:hypothetical protein